MLGTLLRRVTVKTLDTVVDHGAHSKRTPVRVAATMLDRARNLVGLDTIPPTQEIPDWTGQTPDQPMWESDRKKLHKHRLDHGIIKPEGEGEAEAASTEAAPMITVYYKRGCPYSRAAMDLLRERELPFEDKDIKGDEATLSWLKIVTGHQTTPQIFIHNKPIGGFDELRALDQSGELAALVQSPPAADNEADEEPAEMAVEDLRARIDDGAEVLLLDVRTDAEVAAGMIKHAVHIPLDQLSTRHDEIDAQAVWIAYCRSGKRSMSAVKLLQAAGFRSVVSLAGGIEAWRAVSGPVVPPAQVKPRTRPTPKKVSLPVVHPEHSPFEGLHDDYDGPVADRLEGDALIERIKEVLDECRPLVQADGGDIELLDVQGDVVHLQLTGNCIGCPSSQATLKQGIERRLTSRIPQITGIASPQLPGGA